MEKWDMVPDYECECIVKRQLDYARIVLHILFLGLFLPLFLCVIRAPILIVSINPPNAWQYMFYCADLWDHQSWLAMHSTEHGVRIVRHRILSVCVCVQAQRTHSHHTIRALFHPFAHLFSCFAPFVAYSHSSRLSVSSSSSSFS